MPFATGNKLSIYYETHGQNGSPLLMITGQGGSIADWLPEHIERLSQKHRVIVFDNRGAGHSDRPTASFTMADFAADTISVLDDLGIRKAHVLGISMGGMIAQHVAINHPNRVLSMILGCTAPTMNVEHPRVVPPSHEVLLEFTKPKSGNRVQDMESAWKLLFTPRFIEQNRALLDRIRDNLLAYPECSEESQQLQAEAAVNTHDTYDLLPNIEHPTLVQAGIEDILIPIENSRIMARLIPNARMIEYENCAHAFLEESGEKAVDDILAFLDEIDNPKI